MGYEKVKGIISLFFSLVGVVDCFFKKRYAVLFVSLVVSIAVYIFPVSIDKSFTKYNAEQHMNEYLTSMVEAINSNDFSIVEKFLAESAYKEQKDYILVHCKENGIKETFKSVDIIDVVETSSTECQVSTNEVYEIKSLKNDWHIERFASKYTVKYIAGEWKITNFDSIEKY